MSADEKCSARGCDRPARAAIRATRPKRDDLRVTIYADNRTAPKTALRYCHACTVRVATELCSVVVDGDDEPQTQTKTTTQEAT